MKLVLNPNPSGPVNRLPVRNIEGAPDVVISEVPVLSSDGRTLLPAIPAVEVHSDFYLDGNAMMGVLDLAGEPDVVGPIFGVFEADVVVEVTEP